ncbi:PREDICTED: dehydrogenase/reductase SDR family member on chromosome X isoform X2 [Nelumbo nucifera]|uniref:Dehydrogenase/reductase SDR family member on chromosome X isoform X2 n=1 Tax=Nelumbo nucifera TaxID=4432 RepID=A0A1U8B634_NELNU|nr:PREDICTED: dehydrogenase/reductase SDR family member on chromosome X isoform X2 [Nelumbo nucifera]
MDFRSRLLPPAVVCQSTLLSEVSFLPALFSSAHFHNHNHFHACLHRHRRHVWFRCSSCACPFQGRILCRSCCETEIYLYLIFAAGRSSDLLSEIIREIKKRNRDAHLKAFQVDLSSFQSMLKFKNSLKQWLLNSDMHPSIQLLINNAGILATSCRFTAEGFDQMMGTNYIGAFFLTNLLLPLLRSSPVPSRIVNVTSFTHRCVFDLQVDEESLSGICFSKSKQYPFAHIYEYSKICLLLFSYELHRQLYLMDKSHPVSVIAVDPGAVETKIMREIPSQLSHLALVVLKVLGFLHSPESGVEPTVDAALAPPEASGVYFFGGRGRSVSSSALSYDTELAKKLWTSSCKLFIGLQHTCRENS